jgi:hypothetical protein
MFLSLLLACGVSPDAFPDRFAEAICDYDERCGIGSDAQQAYCITEMTAAGELHAMSDGYDPAQAAKCLHELEQQSCDATSEDTPECNAFFDATPFDCSGDDRPAACDNLTSGS